MLSMKMTNEYSYEAWGSQKIYPSMSFLITERSEAMEVQLWRKNYENFRPLDLSVFYNLTTTET